MSVISVDFRSSAAFKTADQSSDFDFELITSSIRKAFPSLASTLRADSNGTEPSPRQASHLAKGLRTQDSLNLDTAVSRNGLTTNPSAVNSSVDKASPSYAYSMHLSSLLDQLRDH